MNVTVNKKRKFSALLVLPFAMTFMLAACNNDDDDAMNDSIYTDPQNGTNNGQNGTGNGMQNNGNGVDNNGNGTDNNGLNNNATPGENGNNQINEGTIHDEDTFDDEARDIIDDTEDMIEGNDNHVHDDRIENNNNNKNNQ